MGYFSCNAESAITTCDSYNFKKTKHHPNITEFNYNNLVTATNSFSPDNFLGKGSHASVYKATLPNNTTVAVKRITHSNRNNLNSPADNEIEILSKLNSPRFVNLVGFTKHHPKLIVVEYMPNGSLFHLLHANPDPPGWSKRLRLAVQIAKAVRALHSLNPQVIHRDIKSLNVLIDGNGNARLSDFGLALMGHVEDVKVKSTPPAGTLGYLDPGYLVPGDLSPKSDVFSFGILLLEILSGRNAIDLDYSPPSIVDWAVPLIKRGDFDRICDGRIGLPGDPDVVRRVAVLAARCVRSTAGKRPCMTEVVEVLKDVRVRGPFVWLRRGRRRVERGGEVFEEGGVVNGRRVGSRRNGKVSSVGGVECENEETGLVRDRSTRSKSIGSLSDVIRARGSVSRNLDLGDNFGLIKKRSSVGVKVGGVRLNKSRSMGVLQSSNFVGYNKGFGKKAQLRKDIDLSKLVISLDEKAEKELLEKPLVPLLKN